MNFHGGNVYDYGRELIDFSSNINPLGVPESFSLALQRNIIEFTKYPDSAYVELRKAIGEYLGLEKIDSIVPGNGAIELIYKAVQQSGIRRLVTLKPTFSEYSRAASQAGIEYEGVSAFDYEYSKVDINKLLDTVRENSAVIICNPNNPTGTLVEKPQMLQLAAALRDKGSYLIVDEAFMEFTEDYPRNSMLDQLSNFKNLIIIKAATKFFGMPGIRLGYAISGSMEILAKIRESMEPWNVNTAAVIAGCTVLKDREYIEGSRLWINEERPYMYASLNKIKGLTVFKSSANFHLVKLDESEMNAWQLKEKLLERNILIRTPEGFEGLNGQYVRLAVKSKESNELLIRELQYLFK
jgi:threonine-phosphate decarboxylase